MRTPNLLRLLAILPLLAGCGPEPTPATPPPQPTQPPTSAQAPEAPAPLAIVSDPAGAKRIAADVTFLASPELAGRGTGEPGGKLAADFIAKRFTDLKLAPLGDKNDKGQDYLQSFQARVGAKVNGASLAAASRAPAKKETAPIKVEAQVATGSADGQATGKTAFVGHGITAPAVGWDDYAGADLSGKIAIVLDGVPQDPVITPPKPPKDQAKGAPHAAPPAPHGADPHGNPHGDPLASSHGDPHGGDPHANPHGGDPHVNPHGGDPHANPHSGDPHGNPHGDPLASPHGDPHGGDPHGSPHGPSNPLRDFGSARYKIRTAREHKAAGVIIVTAKDDLPTAPLDASSMGIPAVVVRAKDAAKIFPALGLDKKTAFEGKKPGKPKDAQEATIASDIKPLDAETWNVVGMIPARADSKTASEYVVVGAHYDHLGHGGQPSSLVFPTVAVHPGADDNASGAAMLLEVARRFSALPRGPARNIIFIAFGGEELGVLGSRHWVDHPPVPIGSVTAMINADMVGRLRDNRLLIDGTGTAARWPDLAKAAAEGLGFNITFGTEGFGASDHTSFTTAKIPVAFLFTGVHDDYHRPTDTAEKINAEGEERIATLAGRLALSVAEAPDRLTFVEAPADPNRGMGRGFKVSLGTVPDYAYDGKGVRLSGVRPDAPASRAGLQAGDTIVKLGGHEITNMHDYMFALGELEAGREVEIEVERAGKRVALKIIPAPGR